MFYCSTYLVSVFRCCSNANLLLQHMSCPNIQMLFQCKCSTVAYVLSQYSDVVLMQMFYCSTCLVSIFRCSNANVLLQHTSCPNIQMLFKCKCSTAAHLLSQYSDVVPMQMFYCSTCLVSVFRCCSNANVLQ
jgi:uncharacterized PurR-regulated membrane protein YhhQ (DUF165 family)